MLLRSILLSVYTITCVTSQHSTWQPCQELNAELRYPCRCTILVDKYIQLRILMDCDNIVFAGEFPPLPYGAPIVSFTQRWSGHQTLPSQIFSGSGISLKSLDLSHNSIRRLPERLFAGIQSNLTYLNLADNLLGDGLNPIFSTSEFHSLSNLEELDLSVNGIRGIEEGLLKGCNILKILKLGGNNLIRVPSNSLNGPQALKLISLESNRIGSIRTSAFISQKSLEEIDLYNNMITSIDGGAFSGLTRLVALKLRRNRLSKFNSDVFHGAENLERLDLSENFITEFPSVAFKTFISLKHLNLSSNMIINLESSHFGHMISLQVLDLSRNNLIKLSPGIFAGMTELTYLDIGINSLRTIEDDSFDGLINLETLLLRDNNILLIPATAFSRLPNLISVHLGYNRVTALSSEILRSISERTNSLVLSRNIIREIPSATFVHFKTLNHLDLSGNLINAISAEIFSGLETSLEYLSLSQNRILSFTGQQLNFVNLWYLDLSNNQLSDIPINTFDLLPNLSHLNLSNNNHISMLPPNILKKLQELVTIDLSNTGLKVLATNIFAKNSKLERIHLHNNDLQEISEGTFKNLRNLTYIDLSNNNIATIRPAAFVNIMAIKYLSLNGNQLNSFKGEFFNTGTSLEVLDVSNNQLSYLFPSSFKIHPRLKKIVLTNNKFNFFPSELINTLQFLEFLDMSGNALKSVEELDFARLPKLRVLKLANNKLEYVSEMAFHNSTQLQIVDLSNNKLDRLGDRTFEGFVRIELLNLSGNQFIELPDTIFDRTRLQMLEKIDLSRNKFESAPLKPLQKQNFFVNSLDLSNNYITDIPSEDSLMVNLKKIDLSFNPLSQTAIRNILSEPKTVRELNLAGTGISSVGQLETPFLNKLNLSCNNISEIPSKTFTRTTLLDSIDLSHNKISNISKALGTSWQKVKNLRYLNLSANPIVSVVNGDFDGLKSVKLLYLSHLSECSRIETAAFNSLSDLTELRLYGLPRLGYYDFEGVLKNLQALEKLDIEVKENAIGSDQLHPTLHPRLVELSIRGERLKTLSSGALAGLKANSIIIGLRNTSLSILPPALLFSLPRSSFITLDVTGSSLNSLQPQLLVALDDRKADVTVVGLESNPIVCDCNARALKRWLHRSTHEVNCASPPHLSGVSLQQVVDDELTCDLPPSTRSVYSTHVTQSPRPSPPDIIWTLPPTREPQPQRPPSPTSNDDTLIIGIVGGVVAFIAILIIAICIVRVKLTSPGPNVMTTPGPWYQGPGSVTKLPTSVRYLPAPPPAPYFLTIPPSDDKTYR